MKSESFTLSNSIRLLRGFRVVQLYRLCGKAVIPGSQLADLFNFHLAISSTFLHALSLCTFQCSQRYCSLIHFIVVAYSFDCFSVDCQWELKTTLKVQGIRIIETHNLFGNLLWNESVSYARHCNRIYETAWNTTLIEICGDGNETVIECMRDCNRVADTQSMYNCTECMNVEDIARWKLNRSASWEPGITASPQRQ